MAEDRERYKQYAAECVRIAQQTTDAAQKARLLEMAEAWQRLAQAAAKTSDSEGSAFTGTALGQREQPVLHPRVDVDRTEASRRAAVAGRHVGHEQDLFAVGFSGAQSRHPLGGLVHAD